MNKEIIWKSVVGYEGYYDVSACGLVRSVTKYVYHYRGGRQIAHDKILKQQFDKDGYAKVILSRYGKLKYLSVHRLVAAAFVKNQNNYSQVNHIDAIKENNNYTNLEWCTSKQNTQHAAAMGLIKGYTKGYNTHPLCKKIIQQTLDGKTIKIWPSFAEIIRNGYADTCIKMVLRGKQEQHKGFLWKYAV